MPDGEYTFVHLAKYGGVERKRIWQSSTTNFISSFHANGGATVFHGSSYLLTNAALDAGDDEWRLTVDQRAFARVNAGQAEGTNESGVTPTDIVINVQGTVQTQLSSWDVAEVLLYDGNLNAADIFTMEVYFATKYGLNFPSLFPTLPSAQSPILLMNAASVNASDSLVNLATGAIIDPTAAVGVTKKTHTVSDGLGATKAFDYMSGTTTSGFKIGADIMPDGEYTFVHLAKYGGAERQRIWQSSTNNFVSGFHSSSAGLYHSPTAVVGGDWFAKGAVSDNDAWRLTVDQRGYGRINAGQLEGTTVSGATPSDIVINLDGTYPSEKSSWDVAEVMLFEGNLDATDIIALEAYFIDKYGLTF
jgi:hypothetical protein